MNAPTNPESHNTEVLTFGALLTLLGRRSRQSVYDLMRRDPSFPKPRQISSEFAIGWLRSEVMAWLNARPTAELNGLDAIERRRRAGRSTPAVGGPKS
jgi:predicted DNA-binding transcriptional regulator AlpA